MGSEFFFKDWRLGAISAKRKKHIVDNNYLDSSEDTITIAHVTRHFCSWHNTRFRTTGTDVSSSSMSFRYTVSRRHTMESPSFHDSLKTSVNTKDANIRCRICYSYDFFLFSSFFTIHWSMEFLMVQIRFIIFYVIGTYFPGGNFNRCVFLSARESAAKV